MARITAVVRGSITCNRFALTNRSGTRNDKCNQHKLTDYFPKRKRQCDGSSPDVPTKKLRLFSLPVFSASGTTKRTPVKRSHALVSPSKDVGESTGKASTADPLGHLARIPVVLLPSVLEHTPISALCKWALASSTVMAQLRGFCATRCFQRKLQRDIANVEPAVQTLHVSRNPFYEYGRFLKTVTFYEGTEARIDLLVSILRKCAGEDNLLGWGCMVITLTANWEFGECAKMLDAVLDVRNGWLRKRIHAMIATKHGDRPDEEIKLRKALRELFLDQIYVDDPERSFWLSALLRRTTTSITRAKLFYLLYAKVSVKAGKEYLMWDQLATDSVASMRESTELIRPLADGLARLIETKTLRVEYRWSHSDVFNLMEEVTTFPDPWCLDNFSAIMLHQPVLLSVAVFARMCHNFEEEAGTIAANVKSLAHRWGIPPSSALRGALIDAFSWLDVNKRNEFFRSFVTANARILNELVVAGSVMDVTDELYAQQMISALMIDLSQQL